MSDARVIEPKCSCWQKEHSASYRTAPQPNLPGRAVRKHHKKSLELPLGSAVIEVGTEKNRDVRFIEPTYYLLDISVPTDKEEWIVELDQERISIEWLAAII